MFFRTGVLVYHWPLQNKQKIYYFYDLEKGCFYFILWGVVSQFSPPMLCVPLQWNEGIVVPLLDSAETPKIGSKMVWDNDPPNYERTVGEATRKAQC